jgi:hypothetical protein
MDSAVVGHWGYDWAWGVPLIVLTVIGHSLALFAMRHRIVAVLANYYSEDRFSLGFGVATGIVVLFVTVLIAFAATLWAGVYVLIGASPNFARAMLYSLEAMTTFGHADVYLSAQWQFLGALEALNGVILLGLSTAFIFSVLHSAQIRKAESQ